MRWLIAALFGATWIGISARRVAVFPVGRPAMALIGAVAVVVAGLLPGAHGLDVEAALRSIEPHTITLLLGMMIVAAGLGEAGFFQLAASFLGRVFPRPAALLWAVTLGAGVLSSLLVNDAVCLLATPFVLALVRARALPVRPFLFAIAMGANAGSALTLSGNPQNMLVAKLSGLTYGSYLSAAAIPTTGALLLTAALLHAIFRKDLALAPSPTPATRAATDALLLTAALAALTTIVLANLLGASLSLSALAGAAFVLVFARTRAETLLAQVDWSVLLFFAGLFVLVAALQQTGLPAEWLARLPATSVVDGHATGTPWLLAMVLAVGSQIVSNVPLILLLEPWIRSLPDPPLAWTLTALVSTLAGNLTLLGSVANIIVIERARERLGFVEYLRVGVLVTTTSIAFAVAALLWLR